MNETPRFDLPPRPAELGDRGVAAWRQDVTIDTYRPYAPTPYPPYLSRRVYQGSSGRVYPLPLIERVDPEKAPVAWDALHIENEWVRIMVLPEIGGRIHVGQDLATGYDFFYRNNVIKPSLVGLAGPWVSGGVEFNWPQHHRPGTFLPVEATIEEEPDGAVTVWCAEHDPLTRMRGVHGVRLRPGSAVVELRVRLTNRTEMTQTFLWWANAAAHANDQYQSFFPPDVHVVADHARRSVTGFPAATSTYYGVDYPRRARELRPDADRIDWYRNILVPTSYMALDSSGDFVGGYDHGVQAGFVHVADHRIAPGKKQWTWGNAAFGQAWDRSLTDGDGPYVEIMAGVFTDNQPDFSFLAPGETRTFSQYWYPIHGIGPAHEANLDAAVSSESADGVVRVGVSVTTDRPGAVVELLDDDGAVLWSETADLGVGRPLVREVHDLPADPHTVVVRRGDGELIRWTRRPDKGGAMPEAATEPPAPEDVPTADELYLTGLHLEQYRHATRSPERYWREALERDPGDSRVNTAMAARAYRRGLFAEAADHAARAIERLTRRNPNPASGEAHYVLGLALARMDEDERALDAFGKAAWSDAWVRPARIQSARIALRRGDDDAALGHLEQVLDRDATSATARCLAAIALRRRGRLDEADAHLRTVRAVDPLEPWAAHLADDAVPSDPQLALDVVLASLGAGEFAAAAEVAQHAATADADTDNGAPNARPQLAYALAEALEGAGDLEGAAEARWSARRGPGRFAWVHRLDEVAILERVVARDPGDARAHAMLGHWYYHVDRFADADRAWRASADLEVDPVVLRNLALSSFDVHRDADAALRYYRAAIEAAPADARLRYELDQLQKRLGRSAAERLAELRPVEGLVAERDDLATEYAGLLVLTGHPDAALAFLGSRPFQPWEGGEGRVIQVWDAAHLAAARTSAAPAGSLRAALEPPTGLGEARHPLASTADLILALGDAAAYAGDEGTAADAWSAAAEQHGDFREMAPTSVSERTFYSVLALRRLGRDDDERRLTEAVSAAADALEEAPAVVDYFATSLPTAMLFEDDPGARSRSVARLLRAQLAVLAGDRAEAHRLLAGLTENEHVALFAYDLAHRIDEW